MPYEHKMGVFLAKDNVRIFYQSWNVKKPKAIILISHGIGEHSGRYQNLLETLDGKGVSFYAADHRGSGKSGGIRGHADKFSRFNEDIKQLYDEVLKKENPGVPIILMGHSLGGLIACNYALENPKDIKGLILSAPALWFAFKVPKWKSTAAKIVASIFPRLIMGNEIDPDFISSDKEIVEAYLNDPLTHDRVTSKFFVEYLKSAKLATKRIPELKIPLLLVHGTKDRIIDVACTEYIFENTSSKDKTKEVFEGLFHETMNEKVEERVKVLKIISSWILKHI